MKKFLLLLIFAAVALAAPNTGTVTPGAFYAKAGESATLRFEFKLAAGVLFNRAGSSLITVENPFTKKALELEIVKGTPYPKEPDDYFETLEPLSGKIAVPAGTKPGVYPVKLSAEMFLCDGVMKVCYRDLTEGKLELRVAQTGKDAPVILEYARPQR
jgi:hypothetical protein